MTSTAKKNYYTNLANFSGTALISETEQLSYGELEQRVQQAAQQLTTACKTESGHVALLALLFSSSIDAVVIYLAALRSQVPVILVDPELAEPAKLAMYEQLGVGFEFSAGSDGQVSELNQLRADCHWPATGAVAVMLSTSGSSGSPKAVMLSAENLHANTYSIAQYLPMKSSDVAITTLPLHYSYGLTVLNTHLAVGASVVLTEQPLMSREFWQQVRSQNVSSLAGVPFHYQMLQMLRLERMELPAMRYLTQAGGKLDVKAVAHFAQLAADKGWQFFVMYGQTEATARMAFVPPELIRAHPDVIGHAIPSGRFEIRHLDTGESIETAGQEGELWYFGNNVMLGYAQQREHWLQPPKPRQALATGDLACWTAQSMVKITGRLSRFIKVRGKRIQLDHLEQKLRDLGVEAYCCGQDDQLFFAVVAGTEKTVLESKNAIQLLASDEMNLHPSLWATVLLEKVPYLASSKINYTALFELCLQQQE